jgi:hypothetical protein
VFTARHVGGPLDGLVSKFAAPRIPWRLYYVPAPAGRLSPGTLSGFMLVGWDDPPEARWPGQLTYVVDEGASELDFVEPLGHPERALSDRPLPGRSPRRRCHFAAM